MDQFSYKNNADKDSRNNYVDDFVPSLNNVSIPTATKDKQVSDESVTDNYNGSLSSVDRSLYECQVNYLESPMRVMSSSRLVKIKLTFRNTLNTLCPRI